MKWMENKNEILSILAINEASSADAMIALFDGDRCLGHAALWWREVPKYEQETLGCIGCFHAESADVCQMLLHRVERELFTRDCSLIVGPMNGNTWRKYRWVTWSDGSPPFLLEPENESHMPLWWQDSGYQELAGYSSSRVVLDGNQVTQEKIRQRLTERGVLIREICMEDYEAEMRAIHSLSCESFSNNLFYTPLLWEDFFQQYQRVKSWINPRYALVATRYGEVVGFVFCLADHRSMPAGDAPVLIVKTLAVKADAAIAGLGNWLVDECHNRARHDGMNEAIHALQYDDNRSRAITNRFNGVTIRRYALFGKKRS